jgi:hypothetical protein
MNYTRINLALVIYLKMLGFGDSLARVYSVKIPFIFLQMVLSSVLDV